MQAKPCAASNDTLKENEEGVFDKTSANVDVQTNNSENKFSICSSNTKSTVIKGNANITTIL